MAAAPANRILEVLCEPVALQIARALNEDELTQAQLVVQLRLGQSVASRSLKLLRAVGLVESDSPRGALRLRAVAEVRQLLLVADRLAEAVMAADAHDQQALSSATRRTVIRDSRPADAGAERRGMEPGA
jgi:DNA-binding transcriptional ArsR family regulator